MLASLCCRGDYLERRGLTSQERLHGSAAFGIHLPLQRAPRETPLPWVAHPPPPHPVQGGTLGIWPKPYRNKTRQIIPNSIHEWRCGQEAANHSLAAVTHSPLLQSSEQGGGGPGAPR